MHLTGSRIFNQAGGVLGADNGRLMVDTVFTNGGTVSFVNSVGTFASAVVNQGAWISDPSTNVFLSNYTQWPPTAAVITVWRRATCIFSKATS